MKIRALQNETGLSNIVLLAAALPVLILLGTAAVDVVRFPIVKQQIRAAIHSGMRFVSQSVDGVEYPVTGMNWCAFPNVLPEDAASCSGLCEGDGGCTGAKAEGMGKTAVFAYGSVVKDKLMAGANGFFTHAKDKVSIDAQLVNLVVDPDTGIVKDRELVYHAPSVEFDLSGSFSVSQDDLTSVIDNFIVDPGSLKLGIKMGEVNGQDRYMHVPVIVTAVSVEVDHIFKFTTGFRFGEASSAGEKSSRILTTVVKPLPLAFTIHN